jgi:phosphoglycerate dehydrogenase-like enzyme
MAELSTKTLHILGIGAIGGEVARLAKAFGMEVIGFNRSGVPHEFADETYKLEELDNHINRADYIVSVLPSTPSTKGFLKGKHFECMKRTAVFINIGRGDVVGEEVIIKALTEKKIDHAFIDVFEREPLEPGHPFWNLENITLTPHISSITNKYMPRSFEIFMHNLHIYINKETQYKNFVDLHRGY